MIIVKLTIKTHKLKLKLFVLNMENFGKVLISIYKERDALSVVLSCQKEKIKY